jgi:vancomycin resistance protein YoaR
VLLVILGLALLAGAGYGAAYLTAGDKVPRGTTVAGVDVGGRSESGAARALQDGLAERTGRSFRLVAGEVTQPFKAEELGLSVDYAASVSDAGGGRSWRPQRLWDYFTGGRELPAVVDLDPTALAAAMASLSEAAGSAPRDGAVAFVASGVQVTPAEPGQQVDTTEAEAMLRAAYLEDSDRTGAARIQLPLQASQPDIDEADVQLAVDSFANPAVSGPVTLVFGSTPVRLQPRDFASALSMVAQDGALVPKLDPEALRALVAAGVGAPGAPVDATVTLVDGRPKVTKAQPGVSYDPATITDSFLAALQAPEGQRELNVVSTVAEPAFTTQQARDLKIKEKVSSFTTYYPYAEYRNINIGRAAELVNGTVLKPGDTFSLNDVVGERTRANGFTEGFVINDGILVEDLGGGVSQMATTTFNAAFFAGLEDVEHRPHSFYISRYPVGREATVAWGAIDLRFKDDTPYGVLVQASVTPATPTSQGVVTVSMWSTKTWDITTTTGERHNPTRPKTRTLDTADCVPNTGYGGFDIDVVRYFRQPGQSALDHQEEFETTYTPSDSVVCTPPPTGAGPAT